jgi:hypothetical protein
LTVDTPIEGTPTRPETQSITLAGAGRFFLTFDTDSTGVLFSSMPAAQVAAALNALPSIQAAGGVAVQLLPGGIFTIAFLADGDRAPIVASPFGSEVPLFGSYSPILQDQARSALRFGGQDATGGKGGDITNYSQLGSVKTRVDLIAGNGGDTINHGNILSTTLGVGRGGSITNASLAGNLGNIDPTVPILSYNDETGAVPESVADFVARIRATDGSVPLTDADGNVGLVAGASGDVYLGLPTSAPNGSVTGLKVNNIMSMVAGSVNRIASIQSISGLQLADPNSQRGSDKGAPGLDYLDTEGNLITAPVLGGALVDGAIIAKSDPTLASGGILAGTRVFKL